MRQIPLSALGAAIAHVPANPRIIVSGNFATPYEVLAELERCIPEFRIQLLNAHGDIPDRDGVVHETSFVGPAMRKSSRLEYFPARLSMVPRLIRTHTPPDIVVVHTSLPRNGYVSLGTEVNVLPAAIESAKRHGGIVIASANPRMPYTFGDAEIPTEDIDLLVEVDTPLGSPVVGTPSDTAIAIGERIAAHIEDGSTLQMGIGDIPNAVLAAMLKRKELHIWSEMFSDGVLRLSQAGALDMHERLTASFVFGSQELYEWLNLNSQVRMCRTEITNNSGRIAKRPQMISINAALQVDLYDQANASRVGGRIYSGFGGSTDFIVGAINSRRGLAFMALPSWHAKSNSSTIVPLLTQPVTSFQHSYVVTEQGEAHCAGASQSQQAHNLIEYAAHPDSRDALRQAAGEMGLA